MAGCGLTGVLPVACRPVNVEALSWGTLRAKYNIEEAAQ